MRRGTEVGVPPGPAKHSLAMVYGGGGPFGIAYGAGVAKGLQSVGIPVATAPALGTSAGSWVAGAIALGLDYEDFADVGVPAVPDRSPGAVLRPAREVFGDARSALVSAVAFGLRRGSFGRTVLRGDEHDLAEICAASSAAPYFLPSHTIDGVKYVDGGVRSATSIPFAADAEHVIVVAPIARGVMGRAGSAMEWLLQREVRVWQRTHPGRRVSLITPDTGIAGYAGTRAEDLFDPVASRAAYAPAIAQGQRWGEALVAQARRAAEAVGLVTPAG